jgi:hypothetical protein
MVHSPKCTIVTDGNRPTDTGFTLGETIHFGSLEFIADCFDRLSLSSKGYDSALGKTNKSWSAARTDKSSALGKTDK